MSNGPTVSTKEIAFSLADPRHLLAGVRLEHDLDLPGHCVDFRYDEPTGSWTLALPRPPVSRLEYKLVLRHPDGGEESTTDPTNPELTPGAFGDKSVLGMPDYAPPAWLAKADAWPARTDLVVSTGVGPVCRSPQIIWMFSRSPRESPARTARSIARNVYSC